MRQKTDDAVVMQRLWHSCVCGLPPDTPASLVDISLYFFEVMAECNTLHYPTLCNLLNDCSALPPASTLTLMSLERFHAVAVYCNIYKKTITGVTPIVQSKMDFFVAGPNQVIGMDYEFTVLIHTTDDAVAHKAANLLVRLYIKPYSQFPTCWPSWTGYAPPGHACMSGLTQFSRSSTVLPAHAVLFY